jgi:Flp pilus assembly pilin Flp
MPFISTLAASLIRLGVSHWRSLAPIGASDEGQDIVEYALLAAFIGIAGWAALMFIDDAVGTTYSSWLDPTVGVPSLWEPAEPVGSGGS